MKLFKRDYYEKLFASKPNTHTIQQYQLQIEEAQKKIEELQSKCDHGNSKVVFYSWRPGAMQPAHVCTECSKYLRVATETESQALWDEYRAAISETQHGTSTIQVIVEETVKK